MMDLPGFFPSFYFRTGIFMRAVIDELHNKIPIEKHIIQFGGAVPGSRENVEKMMEAGKPLIIYPGGMIEQWKDIRVVPKYTLVWKDRAGFARLAAKHNYLIVPFASVGFEDMVTMKSGFQDSQNLPDNHNGYRGNGVESSKRTFSKGYIPPPSNEVRIPVHTPWYIKPQCNYIVIGKPIDTSAYDHENPESFYELRDTVREAVEGCIQKAKEYQENDPERYRKGLGAWNTLGVLAENDLTATFFIDPEWAQENVNLIIEANVAGHSFGLSVVNVADLVVPSCTNCDQPVDPVTFPSYVQTVQEEWNIAFGANGIPAALRLVAFTNASYTDLVDTPSTINRYSSLQSAFMAVGISPVVMSFGVDVWIPQSAVENAAVLSNVLGEVQNLDYAYWAARQALAGQLEDPAVVASEASYLATAYALRAVAITECLNGEVN
ncbi:hypothetical protein HDU83_006023 [Entophlyctis luteolus]|nr:hypothetical protein HDU83_006023 [Entophlyctis luteolus]